MTRTLTSPKLADGWELPSPPKKRMSEEEFLRWASKHEVKAEWVDGEVIVMAPANVEHNDLTWWLLALLRLYVEKHDLGLVLFDTYVRYALRRRPRRRVPDIYFVSKPRLKIVKPTMIDGVPDLVMEVISPDSQSRDRRVKFLEYQSVGVREYWVIDPLSQVIEGYSLGSDRTFHEIAEQSGKLASTVVQGWYLRPQWLWKSPRVSVLDVLPKLGVR